MYPYIEFNFFTKIHFLFFIIILIYLYFKFVAYSYWKKHGVPHENPTVPFGTMKWDFIFKKTNLGKFIIYNIINLSDIY